MKDKLSLMSLLIIAILSLWALSGCGGSDGPIGTVGNTGSSGATGATGATGPSVNYVTLTINATTQDGVTPAVKFQARLLRTGGTLKTDAIEASDTSGTGTCTFQELEPGTYELTVFGDNYFSYYDRISLTENKIINILLYSSFYVSANFPSGVIPDPNQSALGSVSAKGEVSPLLYPILDGTGIDGNTWNTSLDVNPADGMLYAALKLEDTSSQFHWYLVKFDISGAAPVYDSHIELNTSYIPSFLTERDYISDLAFDASGNLYAFFSIYPSLLSLIHI